MLVIRIKNAPRIGSQDLAHGLNGGYNELSNNDR